MRTELRDGERLEIEVRKHWVMLVFPVFMVVVTIVLFVCTFLYPWLEVLRGIFLAGVVCACMYFLYVFYDRETNIWAVTNMRVIDEWGVFTRNTKDSPLDRIHNVSYQQSVPGLILGYGDVRIQTAAEEGATLNRYVENPKALKDAIIKCQDEFRRMQIREEIQNLREVETESNTTEGEMV